MANKKKVKKTVAPIQNNALKNAIAALKTGADEEKQQNFLKEVMKAKFLVPALFNTDFKPDAQGRMKVPANTQVSFLMVNTNQGKSFLPAFTDIEEAKKLNVNREGNLQYIVRTLKEYEGILSDPRNTAEGVVINPMNENIVLPKPLVLALIRGTDIKAVPAQAPAVQKIEPGQVPPGMTAVYSEPRIYPTALVNAVYDHCTGVPEISRVWLRQQLAGNEVAFALVVEADKKDAALLENVRNAALPLAKEVPVVVISWSEAIDRTVVQGAVPLYDRELEI
ncbi:MAG: enhanced serine sensitivity protein SseB [Erysipelotrichaceae bacterium]|nr:enhanced serine sensitivity protein SseB [Erysipelotrichaceae bacterium]